MVTGEHGLCDIESEIVAEQIHENLKLTAMCAQGRFRGASRAGMEENLKRTVVIYSEVHVRVCLPTNGALQHVPAWPAQAWADDLPGSPPAAIVRQKTVSPAHVPTRPWCCNKVNGSLTRGRAELGQREPARPLRNPGRAYSEEERTRTY